MRVDNINKVKPSKDNAVVKHIELDTANELFFAKSKEDDLKNAPLDIGQVVSAGPLADNMNSCPGVKPGDFVIHNAFAGSHIATSELKEMYKIMDGYSLIAKLDDVNNLDENTVHPAANRLLLGVKFVDELENGLFIPAEESKDPSLEDLDYGVVLSVGPSCKLGYKVGDIVAYHPYSGENIRPAESADKPALRVLIEEDILLSI